MSARRSSRTATPTPTAAASTPDPAAPDDQAVPIFDQAGQARLLEQMSAFLAQHQAMQDRDANAANAQRQAIDEVQASVSRRFTEQSREADFAAAQAAHDRRNFVIGAHNNLTLVLTKSFLRMKFLGEDTQAIRQAIETNLAPEARANFPAMPLIENLYKTITSEQYKLQAEIERVRLTDRFKGTHGRLPAIRDRFSDAWSARIQNRTEWSDTILAEDLTWLAREAKDLQNHLDSATMLDSVANNKKRNNNGNRGGRQVRGRGGRNNRGGGGSSRGNGNRQAATAGAEAVVGE